MKKRLLSLVLCLVMVFSLFPSFAMASVYPVEGTDPAKDAPKVVFYDGSTQMGDPQYISSAAATVSDPGAPTLTGRQFFQGWCLKADLSDDSMTIDQLNDYIHVEENYNAIKAAGVLNVYAKVVNSYTVTYIAKDADVNADIVKKVDVVPASDAVNYKVSMSYTPTGANQEFRGWKYNNHTYQQGDSLPVTEDIVLNAEVATGYWIKFDDNDKLSDGTNIHASYQKPVLVAHNEGINLSDYAVSASGYEFQGWFTEKTGGTKVESYAAGELKADVTLYAHWNPVDTANYKVIIWKQNVDGKSYDYAETVTLSGTPGSRINTVTQQGTGNNAYAVIDGTAYRGVNKDDTYYGFHLDHFDQNVTIKPQGSSVLNVYYNRNQHTLRFQADFGDDYYYAWRDVKVITALYGQPIGSNFPIVGKDGTEYRDSRWDPQSSTPYENVLVYIDTMPDYDVTFHEDTASYSTKTIHYYVEALPGQTADGTYDGKGFIEHKSVDANYNYFTEAEDYIDLVGFSKSDSYPPVAYNDNGTQLKTVWENKSARHVYCFYLRKDYPINYQDGVYVKKVTDNGQTTEQPVDGMTSRGQLDVESGILYESDLASYNANGSKYFAPTFPGYTFAGWFKDPACTQAYTFTTMPVGGITVYAKWVMNRYQVEIKDGDTTLSDFTADYLEAINPPTTVAGHGNEVLVGWYTGENYAHSFNPGTKINDNTTDLNTNYTVGGVKGKLTINAKWRAKLASCINVKYVADNGNAPTDSLNYTDESLACAKSAPTGVTGAQFLYWVVLDAAGNETTIKVYPGQTFTVDAQYAKKDSTPYKLTLKAVYNTSTSETTTLTYDPNGGALAEGVQATVENIPVNGVVTLYGKDAVKDNYLFLGWNHDKTAADNHVVEFLPGVKVGVDKLPDKSNTLYAVWEEVKPNTYVIDFNAKMKVAEEASCLKDETSKNGVFAKSQDEGPYDVTYQLNSGKQAAKTATINSAYTDVDTALVYGKPMNVAGAKIGWNQINTVPASSVYYDDDFTKEGAATYDVGDGSGNISGIAPDVAKATIDGSGKHCFTFYGTGIDVYCTTDDESGFISAAVFKGTDTKGERVGDPITVKNYSGEGTRYNTPTVSFKNLPSADTYTIMLSANTEAKIKIDGVRVYNPVQADTTAATELNKTPEANATYLNLRSLLVNGEQQGYKVDNAIPNGEVNPTAVSGVLFIDDVKNVVTKSHYDKDQVWHEEPVEIYQSQFDVYKANGPKNEIYLDGQQAITFQLNIEKVKAGGTIWIGLSAPETGSGTVSVTTAEESIAVNSVMDMYYPVTVPKGGSITITNNGTNRIALTNLKITAASMVAPAAPAPGGEGQNSIENARAFFMPVTLMTVRMAANNGVDPEAVVDDHDSADVPDGSDPQVTPDTPSTPDQPDDPKPVWNDGVNSVQTILKTLFQYLLNSLNSLFSGLGKW